MKTTTQLLILAALSTFAVPASAHLGLTSPTSRYGQNVLKTGPCGMGDGPRSDNVTTLTAGETITVEWDEYIDHPGHYRISFDEDGQDDFVDPPCLAECDNRDMEIELNSNAAVLLDGIEDREGGGAYSAEVTLPNVECDNCTLQVIQVMTDKPPYEIPGNDLYYQCADLVLEAGAADMGGGEPDMGSTAPDGGTGDDAGANNTPGNNNTGNNQTSGDNTGNNGSGGGGSDAGTSGQAIDDISGESGCCATAGAKPSGVFGVALLLLGLFGWRRRH